MLDSSKTIRSVLGSITYVSDGANTPLADEFCKTSLPVNMMPFAKQVTPTHAKKLLKVSSH